MLTVNLHCELCGTEFQVSVTHLETLFGREATLPKSCPECHDKAQARPTAALERKTLLSRPVKVGASLCELLSRAEVFQATPTDQPCHRRTVRGDWFGASWRGRIDIWSYAWPLEVGKSVTFAHQFVRERTYITKTSRQIGTMYGNPRSVEIVRRVSPDTPGAETRVEEQEYVVLLPVPPTDVVVDDLPTLCWVRMDYKTTLKGLGRQIYGAIEGDPFWKMVVSGAVRSGRAGGEGWLCIIEANDRVKVRNWGDLDEVTYYP